MQPLSQLADQPLALGGAELVVPVEGLPQGGQLALLWLPEPGRWGAEGAPHEAAEGVSPALQIAEATIGLQLTGLLQGCAPGPQVWWTRGQIPSEGFNWLS
jgi:hypothetical protein